ncbi:MAG TPA: nucleoside recognition domain-containing protein, partial [Bacilli bacterium]
MVALILGFPEEGLKAAVRGVAIWWDVLFPALFPFFVISEMMLGFGIVHFIGTLLDPMMRPLFRVPGIGGFVMAMGFASGYPVGARLTSQIWEQKLVNREEGERLVSFTTTSDPIFLIGAVAIGFFHDASLAAILAVTHYGAAVVVAFIMRYHGDKNLISTSPIIEKGFILTRASEAMHQARISDGRAVGQLLKEAIQSSLRLVFMIG